MLPPLLQALQAVGGPETAPFWPTLGIGGGLAALMFTLWRQDRQESQSRFEKLAADFRDVIEDNTKAMTALLVKIDDLPDRCAAAELLVEIVKKGKPINLEP
jgi:hypothetical protein